MRTLSTLLLIAGCYQAKPPDGTLQCSNQDACPAGYQCAADHYCYDHPVDLGAPRGDLGVSGDGGCGVCAAPKPSCVAGGLLHSTPSGCDDTGACSFTNSIDPCASGHAPTCSGSTETDYDLAGSCAVVSGTAQCVYPSHPKPCASGCAATGDVCDGDPCAGSSCSTRTPANQCNGLSFASYAPDSCSSATGTAVCQQHQSTTDCSGTNPCVAYACDPSLGCTTTNKPASVSCSGGFCMNGACTARSLGVAIAPTSANLHVGATRGFTATVTSNDPDDSLGVTWSLSSAVGALSMSTQGTVSYTAPPATSGVGSVNLVATSIADSSQSQTAAISIYPALAASALSPATATVHAGATLLFGSGLDNLSPSDSGQGSFSALHGSLSMQSCALAGPGSTSCGAKYLAPSAPGTDTITFTSSDDPTVKSTATITIIGPITLSLDKASVDLLAFGTPARTQTVNASVANLADGDSGALTLSASGGSAGASLAGHVITVNPSASANFGLLKSAPPATSVLVASNDDPTVTATLTVNVHAFIDDSAAFQAAFGSSGLANAVAINAAGDVMVGGHTVGSSTVAPVAAVRKHATGAWSLAYSSSTAGNLTGLRAADDGSFVVAGVQGAADGSGNQPLLVLHYAGTAFGSNLAPVASAYTGYAGPQIVSFGGYKYLSYNKNGNTCANGSKNSATVLYNANNNLDSAFSAANVYPFGTETPAGSSAGNSCPFNPYQTSSVALSLEGNSGNQLWLSGDADCGLTNGSGNGCTATTATSGVAEVAIGTTAWQSFTPTLSAAGISLPRLARGYDDSMVIGGSGHLFYYAAGAAPAASGSRTLNAAFTSVDTLAGAAAGGAPWAGAQPDLFASFSTHLAWILGSSEVDLDSATTRIDKMVIVRMSSGAYEGWAIGSQNGGGTVVAYHLL